MGMFDRVVVEFNLPDIGASAVPEWQTKSFDPPIMDLYKITQEGILLRELVHFEDRSDPKAEGIMRLMGCMTRIHEGWEDTHYHGILNFYGDAYSGQLRRISLKPETFGQDLAHPQETEWFEYNAKFTNGKLTELERVRNEVHP